MSFLAFTLPTLKSSRLAGMLAKPPSRTSSGWSLIFPLRTSSSISINHRAPNVLCSGEPGLPKVPVQEKVKRFDRIRPRARAHSACLDNFQQSGVRAHETPGSWSWNRIEKGRVDIQMTFEKREEAQGPAHHFQFPPFEWSWAYQRTTNIMW